MHRNPPPGSGSTMQRETTDNLHIKSYAPHFFRLNDESEWNDTAILLQNKEVITDPNIIPTRFEDLTESHFAAWAERQPTVILIGTGNQMQFLEPKWRAYFYQRGIGIETMATESLCRTFAILATEDRNALGVFFPIEEK